MRPTRSLSSTSGRIISTMHHPLTHRTPHPKPQPPPSIPTRIQTEKPEGMQSLTEDMKRISVSKMGGNGVSAPQASGQRWTREGGRDRGRMMNSRGMGQGQGDMSDWRSGGRQVVSSEGGGRERPSWNTRPDPQRYSGYQNSTISQESHHYQPREQQAWRPTPQGGQLSPLNTPTPNFRQRGEGTRSAQEGQLSSNRFAGLEADDSARPKRTWGSKLSTTVSQKPTEGNRQRIDGATSSPQNANVSVNPLPMDPATKFVPITQTIAMPPHLQHSFRLYEPGTTFDISAALNAEAVTERHPTTEYLAMAQASPNEYYTLPLRNGVDPRSTRKLVVLDLNGALLVRSKRSKISSENISRRVYARPFLPAFLSYILKSARPLDSPSNPSDPTTQEMRPYDAFVWSSAQPINVDGMIRSAFGKWGMPTSPRAEDRVMCEAMLRMFERVESRSGRILGVWTRDEMDLTRAQYGEFRCGAAGDSRLINFAT